MQQLFLGAACLGFAPIFVKLVFLGPTPIGFYRCGLAAIFLMAAATWEKRGKLAVPPFRGHGELWAYMVLSGVLFAVDLFVWHRSVIYAGAGLGTILGNTQVFYVAAAGIVFYREKLTARFFVSVLLAFVGTFLLVGFRNAPTAVSDRYWDGVFYGLTTGIVYCSYVLVVRKVEKLSRGVSATVRLALISGTTAIVLLPISLAEGTMRLPSLEEWAWLISLALVAQVMGWLLISRNLMKVPVSSAGLILITQPLVATIAGAIFFHERLSSLQILGALIVFVALYLGTSRKKNPPAPA